MVNFTIGQIQFILKNLPPTWLKSESGQRLNLFISEPEKPSTNSFHVQIVDTIRHPPLESFRNIGHTLCLTSINTDQQYYITDEVKSVIDWLKNEMKLELLPTLDNSEHDDMDKVLIHLRQLVSFIAIRRGGAPLHSSCVYKHSAALVFLGRSGRGKTTIARIMQKYNWMLLNDEFNLIMPWNKTYRIYSTPFTKRAPHEIHAPGGVKIIELFNLNHGEFLLNNTTPEKKVKLFLESVYLFPDYSKIGEFLFDNVITICSEFNLRNLYFRNCDQTAKLIEKNCTWSYS